MRLRPKFASFPVIGGRRSGYTLVEILVAMTLTLMLMTAVVTVFGGVGDGIAKSRRAMEQFDRLRTTAQQLRMDLQGVTVTLDGRPTRPEEGRGYFEAVDAGNAQNAFQMLGNPNDFSTYTNYSSDPVAVSTGGTLADGTVGPRGDILMFTTRNAAHPFLGRYAVSVDATNPTLQSDVAEVAWFLRGKTLHRRVLLVAPDGAALSQYYQAYPQKIPSYYALNDISARLGSTANGQRIPVPNSLGDLTKRENRFAHPVDRFPFDVRRWGLLGLPTLFECTSTTWMGSRYWTSGTTPWPVIPSSPFPIPPFNRTPVLSGQTVPQLNKVDMWEDIPSNAAINVTTLFGAPAHTPDQYLVQDGSRLADDVILTNVIGFDVKFWDPGAPIRSFPDPATNQPVIVKPGDLRYPEALLNPAQQIVSYGAYVDLGWGVYDQKYPNPKLSTPDPQSPPAPPASFWAYPNPKSGMNTQNVQNPPIPSAAVYDSFCFSYENEGIYSFDGSGNPHPVPPTSPNYPLGLNKVPAGTATNGLDDAVPPANNPSGKPVSNGVVDDQSEYITSPPYPVPLRGIQVTIRCYEPDSRQVRPITIEHDFLPK